jgi:hypothetical protein
MITQETNLYALITEKLATKTAALHELVKASGLSIAEATRISHRASQLRSPNEWAEFYKDQRNDDGTSINMLFDEINGLTETLKSDLMYCPKKYVVISEGESLQSPSGFNLSDRVFIQTKIAIHTDTLKNKFPDVGGRLAACDLDKTCN